MTRERMTKVKEQMTLVIVNGGQGHLFFGICHYILNFLWKGDHFRLNQTPILIKVKINTVGRQLLDRMTIKPSLKRFVLILDNITDHRLPKLGNDDILASAVLNGFFFYC